MCNGKCSSGCVLATVAKVLVIVGGLNWGLVGVGMLMGLDLNLVNMLLGKWMTAEAVVYVLVGVSAVVMTVGCPCVKCKSGACATCVVGEKVPPQQM